MKPATIVLIFLISNIAATAAAAQIKIQARPADELVGSMGINVHMESPFRPYKKYAEINEKLKPLGMRHFRDEINDTDESFVSELNYIGTLGYSLCGLIEGGNDYPPVGENLDRNSVASIIENLQPTIDAVEGPNEPDDKSKPPFQYGVKHLRFPQGAVEESENLWEIVEGNPQINALPVLAMSEGNPQDFGRLAARTMTPIDYATYGNMHAYQGGLVGDAGLTSLYIPDAQLLTGSKPLWTTEMGYHNYTKYLSDGEQQGVSNRASAIYLPIAFLSGFNQNVLRTFSYELIDEVDDPQLTHTCGPSESGIDYCMGEGHYGLLNFDGSPKPAFTALQNLIALLAESGAPDFTPGSLTVTFADGPYTMRYTLLEKSNGDYYLAIWNDVPVYQLATQTKPGEDLYRENVPVILNFSTLQPLAFTVYAPNDTSGVNPTDAYTLSTTPSSIQVDLPAKVLLIKIAGNH